MDSKFLCFGLSDSTVSVSPLNNDLTSGFKVPLNDTLLAVACIDLIGLNGICLDVVGKRQHQGSCYCCIRKGIFLLVDFTLLAVVECLQSVHFRSESGYVCGLGASHGRTCMGKEFHF